VGFRIVANIDPLGSTVENMVEEFLELCLGDGLE
jgi:hypothetical protein